ncbi:MAG: hypothetical protein ABIG68_06675 [Acidobacteriota bacterium]
MRCLMQSLEPKYGRRARSLLDSCPANTEPAVCCGLRVDFYSMILLMPDNQAGPLLRYVFSERQSKRNTGPGPD